MNEYEKMGLSPEEAKVAATTGVEAYHLAMLANHFVLQDELQAIVQKFIDDTKPVIDAIADTLAEDRKRSRNDLKQKRREMWRRKVK